MFSHQTFYCLPSFFNSRKCVAILGLIAPPPPSNLGSRSATVPITSLFGTCRQRYLVVASVIDFGRNLQLKDIRGIMFWIRWVFLSADGWQPKED